MGPFKAIGAIFTALFTIANVANRGANALDQLMIIGEEEAKSLNEQMALEREARRAQWKHDNADKLKLLDSTKKAA